MAALDVERYLAEQEDADALTQAHTEAQTEAHTEAHTEA
jgi:hypothetical protein